MQAAIGLVGGFSVYTYVAGANYPGGEFWKDEPKLLSFFAGRTITKIGLALLGLNQGNLLHGYATTFAVTRSQFSRKWAIGMVGTTYIVAFVQDYALQCLIEDKKPPLKTLAEGHWIVAAMAVEEVVDRVSSIDPKGIIAIAGACVAYSYDIPALVGVATLILSDYFWGVGN
ncbi:MAG: hypothetical protein MRY21_00115 [Simkaniaceae bacterium]|nr:hypothetical protein [Simkaniaceae bacterium]